MQNKRNRSIMKQIVIIKSKNRDNKNKLKFRTSIYPGAEGVDNSYLTCTYVQAILYS
jgi:hypothetical protein